jgi:Uma2 family endonuclease
MVAARDNLPRFTPEEYFAWEELQLEKHEYIEGEVYAMTGGSINHGRISIRFTSLFESHLSDRGCITGNSDIRVNILETDDYTYPDASVTCDERDKSSSKYITYPCTIVEVLSDSTEAYDRGEKFYRYRRNPILQEYVLVNTKTMAIDLYRKNSAGEWVIINYRGGELVELASINLSFPIEQIYRGINLDLES